jgi:PAS domain-containing protein
MHDIDPLDLVETIREGIFVLEPDLTIRLANRSFCHTFAVAPEHTVGRKLYEIGNGQWDIPKLRTPGGPPHNPGELLFGSPPFPELTDKNRSGIGLNLQELNRPQRRITNVANC